MYSSVSNIFSSIKDSLQLEGEVYSALCKMIENDRLVDLVLYKPREFINRRNFKSSIDANEDELITVKAQYRSSFVQHRKYGKEKRFSRFSFVEESGLMLEVLYFVESYLQKKLKVGEWYFINGKVTGENQITHPDKVVHVTDVDRLSSMDPKYRLSDGMKAYKCAILIKKAISVAVAQKDWLDPEFRARNDFPSWAESIRMLHAPQSELEYSRAVQRLAYDEILAMRLVVTLEHSRILTQKKDCIKSSGHLNKKLCSRLSFSLTGGQKEIISKIFEMQARPTKMLTLLQGDVGSGKTMVAFMAMLNAVEAGKQVILLVPTTVLARQHYEQFLFLMPEISSALMISGQSNKKNMLSAIKSGEISVIIGTHAVLTDDVEFSDLGLVVIDEQHRFGAEQRTKLIRGNRNADLLLVTATPIPRTISQVMFGSIEILNLREKPKERVPIQTSVIAADKLPVLIERLRVVIEKGAKVFWVCSLVQDNEDIERMSLEKRYKTLLAFFKGDVGYIHGGLSSQEIEAKIDSFRNGEKKILVSTTVVEVGVDVPDADVIIIEDADKFGMAQLHQLRGRVGRSNKSSFCVLIYNNETITEIGKKRLQVVRHSDDGFEIAEKDFQLRGSGDLLGSKQSGFHRFKFIDAETNKKLFDMAESHSNRIAETREMHKYEVLIKIFFSDNNYYL